MQAFANDQLYLNTQQISRHQLDPEQVEHAAGEAALTLPGVIEYFTRAQILQGRMPQGLIATHVINGFNPARSGDVWLALAPFTFFTEKGLGGTTHGSPYHYDTHVPIILFGAGVRSGRFNTKCTPSDIIPTVAAILGIEPPSNQVGQVLVDAMTDGK